VRTRVAVLLTAVMTAAAAAFTAVVAGPASAQANQVFSAFGTGTVLSTNVLTVGTTTVGGVHAARAAQAVNSQGLAPRTDELGQNVNPALANKNAYGRGTGLEVGLAVPAQQQATANQLLLTGLAEASAPPPSDLITREIALDLSPVAFASLLRGQAQAIYDPNICAIGQPISYGLGYAANVHLVGEPGTAALATSAAGNNVSQTRSFSYFIPNGDGTFGLASEVRQIAAPVSILNTALGPTLLVEVAGEFGLRAVATGKPGGARIENLGNPLITIRTAGGVPVLGPVRLSDLLGQNGLTLDLSPIALVSVGQPPRAIGGPPGSAPTIDLAGGTRAAAAIDVVSRVQLLEALGVLDLSVGHMEVSATVPAGGVRCNIPVGKTATPNPAAAGDTITWTISIPSDPALFARFFACDLFGIRVTDTHGVQSGNPRIQLLSASNGGVVRGNTVTWENLGNYTRGQPPIRVTVTGRVVGGTGVVRDTADVTATLGNCTGGAAGQAIVGQAQFQGAAISGSTTLIGPDIGRGRLVDTGGDSRYLVLGGALLFLALELRRRLRRRTGEVASP
jgi:hypothetical protein